MGGKSAKQVRYQEPEPVKRVSQEDRKIRDDAQAQAARAYGTAGTDITRSGGDGGVRVEAGRGSTVTVSTPVKKRLGSE